MMGALSYEALRSFSCTSIKTIGSQIYSKEGLQGPSLEPSGKQDRKPEMSGRGGLPAFCSGTPCTNGFEASLPLEGCDAVEG